MTDLAEEVTVTLDNGKVDSALAQLVDLFPSMDSSVLALVLSDHHHELQPSIDHILSSQHPQSSPASLPALPSVPELSYAKYVPKQRSSVMASSSLLPPPPPKDELDRSIERLERMALQGAQLANQGASKLKSVFQDLKRKLDQPPSTSANSALPPIPPPRDENDSVVPSPLPRPLPFLPAASPVRTPPLDSTPSTPTTPLRSTLVPSVPTESPLSATIPTTTTPTAAERIGLLPRQSISLKSSTKREDDEEDDEDLEYVRNPFDQEE